MSRQKKNRIREKTAKRLSYLQSISGKSFADVKEAEEWAQEQSGPPVETPNGKVYGGLPRGLQAIRP